MLSPVFESSTQAGTKGSSCVDAQLPLLWWDSSEACSTPCLRLPNKVEPQLPPVITGFTKHVALAAFPPVSLPQSASSASWAHLPHELPMLKSLSQGWLLGEPKLRQIEIMY